MPIDRAPTPYDDNIYSADWRAWRDPEVPEWINPVDTLIGRHLGTPIEDKPALIADGVPVSYGALRQLARRHAGALATAGLTPEARLLLFGTDSLDYIATWLGAIDLGAVPAVVSDLYKPKDLLYFLTDTAARMLFIDSEQLPKLVEIASALPPSLRTVLVRGPADDLAKMLPELSVVSLEAAVARAAPVEPHPRHFNDVTYMFYSGGTTGTPKASPIWLTTSY
jgi:benzoate-CoA ligase